MLRLLIISIVIYICAGLVYYIKNKGAASAKQKLILCTLALSLLVLILSGKMHWLFGLFAGLLGVARPLLPQLIRYFPFFKNIWDEFSPKSASNSTKNNLVGHNISRNDALNILGLEETASDQEILRAYKGLMQKCHPDRGGSDYLATQLNAAKKKLLG